MEKEQGGINLCTGESESEELTGEFVKPFSRRLFEAVQGFSELAYMIWEGGIHIVLRLFHIDEFR